MVLNTMRQKECEIEDEQTVIIARKYKTVTSLN